MLLAVEDLAVEYAPPSVRSVGAAPLARAVDGVTLSLAAGQALALVGESGSGKTTVALALFGLLPMGARVVRGAARLDGTDLLGRDAGVLGGLRGARMALVFQDAGAALHPTLTIGDQVGEPLRIHRSASRGEARAEAVRLLARVGIGDAASCARRYPHQLSGGMRQRALLAMAIACGPALLVADEPTGALDVTVQAEVLDLLDRLRVAHGMALLHVTHDLALAAERSDEVAVMYAGRVVERAPTQLLFRAPAHPYTAQLLRDLALGRSADGEPAPARDSSDQPVGVAGGCAFRGRCPGARARCSEEAPALLPLDAERAVRCHFPVCA